MIHASGPDSVEGPSRSLSELGWGWLSPVLLLSVPVELLVGGREALALLLLVFVAPLLTLFMPSAGNSGGGTFGAAVGILTVGMLLWANLSLAGDIAVWLGGSRWSGVLVGAGGVAALAVSGLDQRRKHLLVLVALLGLVLPLVVVLRVTDPLPLRVWSRVASQPVFRFPPDSLWVTEGRSITGRRGVDALEFQEEHRLIPLTGTPLRLTTRDGTRVRIEELAVLPGQPLVLRPGDRLQADPGARFRFEGGKRIPGAPVSGIGWADAPLRPRGLIMLKFLGLGITLVGGAVTLISSGYSRSLSRGGAALLGLLLLTAVGWGQCWAVYTAAYSPEVFLGGVTGEKLLELPAFILHSRPWARWLVMSVLVGLLAGFLASAAILRGALTRLGNTGAQDLRVWGGLLALAGVASLWPVDPWTLLLLALGLSASTLAPAAVVGCPPGRPVVAILAMVIGFVLFAGGALAGRLSAAEGSVIFTFPALIAAPVASGILWLAHRLSPEGE